jgi:hypothetical protein
MGGGGVGREMYNIENNSSISASWNLKGLEHKTELEFFDKNGYFQVQIGGFDF